MIDPDYVRTDGSNFFGFSINRESYEDRIRSIELNTYGCVSPEHIAYLYGRNDILFIDHKGGIINRVLQLKRMFNEILALDEKSRTTTYATEIRRINRICHSVLSCDKTILAPGVYELFANYKAKCGKDMELEHIVKNDTASPEIVSLVPRAKANQDANQVASQADHHDGSPTAHQDMLLQFKASRSQSPKIQSLENPSQNARQMDLDTSATPNSNANRDKEQHMEKADRKG